MLFRSFFLLLLIRITSSGFSCDRDTGFVASGVAEKEKYKTYDLHPPMAPPLLLAGSFCELRSNHFHTGIDIKTGGVTGKKVYSIENGYVSRVKVGLRGYGKAVYITHPNGFTSVYAHLSRFEGALAHYVKKAQYSRQKHQIELYPAKDKFRVKKGEVIAISGNSGSSVAPHLHFEIRESHSEKPLNPLLFNFEIRDNIPPVISTVRVYPLSKGAYVNGRQEAKSFGLTGNHGKYTFKATDPLLVHGDIGFAVETTDRLNGTSNRCAIYTIALFADGRQIFGQRLEKMDFSVNRYHNAHTDYEQFTFSKKHFHRSFLLPNNQLPIYENVVNRGWVQFTDTLWHRMEYVIRDPSGNTSTCSFKVRSVADVSGYARKKQEPYFQMLAFDKENEILTEGLVVRMPPYILYDSVPMQYKAGVGPPNSFAPLHHLHHAEVPVHHFFHVKIRLDTIPVGKENKLMVVSISRKGEIYNEQGTYNNGWMSARARSFGDYTVMMDNEKPTIVPLNFKPGENMAKNTEISFKVADNLSGISSYQGAIDGKWVLLEYDPKRSKMFYVFDEHVDKGAHEVKITVYDERENKATYTARFIR